MKTYILVTLAALTASVAATCTSQNAGNGITVSRVSIIPAIARGKAVRLTRFNHSFAAVLADNTPSVARESAVRATTQQSDANSLRLAFSHDFGDIWLLVQ